MAIQALLLDVEGVLVADKRYQAVQGAVEFIRQVRDRRLRVRLVTNNTTDTKAALVEKLNRAGFDFRAEEIRTCTAAAVNRLRTLKAERCMVLGAPALRRMFADEGFVVVDESEVGAVVVGLDTGLTYERLRQACDAVMRCGARLIALHRNRLYPDEQGRPSPSVGPIVEAIRYATGVEPEVMGKPSPACYRQALEDLGVAPEAAIMISDDPFSDLAGAKRLGIATAFVLTGKYTDRAILDQVAPDERPDVTVEAAGDLFNTAWFVA